MAGQEIKTRDQLDNLHDLFSDGRVGFVYHECSFPEEVVELAKVGFVLMYVSPAIATQLNPIMVLTRRMYNQRIANEA